MENTKYNSLSNYLIDKLNDNSANINEAFWDNWFGKGKSATDEQKKKGKGLLGLFGSLFSAFSSEKDPISEAYEKTMKAEQEQLDKQAKEIEDDLNKLEAAKIEAKSEMKRRQLELKHQEKRNALSGRLAQVNAFKDRAKTRKVILSANESDALLSTLEDVGKDMKIAELGNDNPVKQMHELALQICVDKDGNVRSFEEIEEAAKNDKDLAEHLENYKKLVSEHSNEVSSALESKEFKEMHKEFQKKADEERAAQANIEQTEKDAEAYKKNCEAVEAIKNAKTKRKDANEALEKAKKAVNEFNKTSPFVKVSNDSGKAVETSNEDFKKGFKLPDNTKIDDFLKDDTAEEGQTPTKVLDTAKYKKYLEDIGVSSEIADKIISNIPETAVTNDLSSINKAIDEAIKGKKQSDGTYENEITDEDIENTKKKVNEHVEKKYAEVKTALSNAEETLKNTPDPNDESTLQDSENDSEETRKLKESLRKHKATYDAIPETATVAGTIASKDELFDTSTETGKNTQTAVNEKKTEALNKEKEIKTRKAARVESRKHALGEINNRKSLDLSADDQEKINNIADQLQAGESIKDGKIGYYKVDPAHPDKEPEFVERKEKMSSKEEEEYVNARDANAILLDKNINKDNSKKVKKVDGKWFEYDSDGNENEISEDEAINRLANKKAAEKSEATIVKAKQDFATSVKTVIKADGTFDVEKYKKLPAAQKEQLKNLIDRPELIDKIFVGMDLDGSDETLSQLKKHLKPFQDDTQKSLDALEDIDAIDTTDDDEYKRSENKQSDYEDEEHTGDDTDDENEYEGDEEEDDEENGTLEDGTKVKKVDGKWYKESDLNDDGTPVENATEQSTDDVTKNKKKKKIKNPAKEFHKRKNKRTGRTTKNYYNKNDESLSPKEFRERMRRYQKAKQKTQKNSNSESTQDNSSLQYNSLKNYLLEHIY